MKQKGHDYSTMIIWGACLVGMIRYAAAFLASDMGQIVGITSDLITFLLGLSGFAMGLLGTFGATYLFDGWRKKMPASGQTWPFKFLVLTFFVMFAFACELAILVPFTVSRMEHATMSEVLRGGVWWWSAAVNVMPMLLLGGVSVGNQIVSVSSTEPTQVTGNFPNSPQEVTGNFPNSPQKVTGNFPTNWRQVRKNLSSEDVAVIAKMTTEQICFRYGVLDRTAVNWRKYAQRELESVEKTQ